MIYQLRQLAVSLYLAFVERAVFVERVRLREFVCEGVVEH